VPGEADGTYKLHHGGWVLLVFGTHTLRTADNGDNVQSFRPFAFSLALSESEASYTKLFECCKRAARELFKSDLKLNTVVSDKSVKCHNAFAAAFPEAKRMLCWPHISRSALCQHRGHLLDQELFPTVQKAVQARAPRPLAPSACTCARARLPATVRARPLQCTHMLRPPCCAHACRCVQALHMCPSQAMFDALGERLIALLVLLGEKKFADWLREQYLTAPWGCWWIGAGDYGALPSNQMVRARPRQGGVGGT